MLTTAVCVCVHGVRLLQQQDQALEREHAAAACRLREASERWEGQLQATRMRLMAENDIKVGNYVTGLVWFVQHTHPASHLGRFVATFTMTPLAQRVKVTHQMMMAMWAPVTVAWVGAEQTHPACHGSRPTPSQQLKCSVQQG